MRQPPHHSCSNTAFLWSYCKMTWSLCTQLCITFLTMLSGHFCPSSHCFVPLMLVAACMMWVHHTYSGTFIGNMQEEDHPHAERHYDQPLPPHWPPATITIPKQLPLHVLYMGCGHRMNSAYQEFSPSLSLPAGGRKVLVSSVVSGPSLPKASLNLVRAASMASLATP